MPAFEVTVQGKTYHVEVPNPGASPLIVVVDGQPFEIEIAGVGGNGHNHEVVARPRPAPVPPPLPNPPRPPTSRPVPVSSTPDAYDVIAPMPGTILSVQVEPGGHVEAGQVLCILEAMKMKNPIRAPHPGTLAEIAVQTGSVVSHGDRLFRIA